MAQPNPHATFSNYAILMFLGGLIAMPQIGIAGLVVAAAAIYSGSCFMSGYTADTPKRKRK